MKLRGGLFMKKLIVLVVVLIVVSLTYDIKHQDKIIIPKDAIRLRILANSDEEHDQKIKLVVKNEVQKELFSLIKDVKEINEARKKINNNLDYLKMVVNSKLEEENFYGGCNITYGKHYFPKKEFMGVSYNEGYYESVLVKIGKGEGKNWWCVLFPPLCLIEINENTNDVEYKFMVKELLKIFF
jgi:stage II sporulation protein R